MKDKNNYQIFRDKVFDDCYNLSKVVKPIIKEYFAPTKKVIIPALAFAIVLTYSSMSESCENKSELGGLETIVSKNEN